MLKKQHRAVLLILAIAMGCGIGYARIKTAPVVMETVSSQPLAGLDLGGPFTLTDQDGTPVTETSWPGQYLLLYFGFTHCPDICPIGLGKLADALNALPAGIAARIQPLFITIDPARDTAVELKKYVTLFHPKLRGLTGTQTQIDDIIKTYRVYAQKQIIDGDEKNYMINHSSYMYLVAPTGKVIDVYAHDTNAADIAAKLKDQVGDKFQ